MFKDFFLDTLKESNEILNMTLLKDKILLILLLPGKLLPMICQDNFV